MTTINKGARLWRRSLRILLAIVAPWLYFAPRISPRLYDRKLFHPNNDRGDLNELLKVTSNSNRRVYFPAFDGQLLHGCLFHNPSSGKILLLHPGNSGDIAGRLSFIKILLQTGASVFAYEPRGFGLSGGAPTMKSICEDGLAAFDYLTAQLGYAAHRIVLYGMSLGVSVATEVSKQRRARGIVLQSGFSSLERIAKERMPLLKIYPTWLFPRPLLDNVRILAKPHMPLLILHGGKDDTIPPAHSREMYAKAASPKQFVLFPNSTHTEISALDLTLFVSTLKQFLSKLA
jgi:dipeptidyl aminopeptidase/acylaminoacyl peptidase